MLRCTFEWMCVVTVFLMFFSEIQTRDSVFLASENRLQPNVSSKRHARVRHNSTKMSD